MIVNFLTERVMTTNEKISAIREKVGLNQHKFSKLIGVAPSTMARWERSASPDAPSRDALEKIAGAFNEISLEWLLDEDSTDLPESLTLSERGHKATTTKAENEGEWLRRFLDRYDITQQKLGDTMGVSRNQAHMYTKTARFHKEVHDSLLYALGKILGRPVATEEVFGGSRLSRVDMRPMADTMIAVPLIRVAHRSELSEARLKQIQDEFVPALMPDSLAFAPKTAVEPGRTGRYFALEIASNDRMEPALLPGYKVLVEWLEPAQYERLSDGVVAIQQFDNGLIVKRIEANRLRNGGSLELSAYNGSSVSLQQGDITLFFRVSRILDGAM
ncbi:hypothetical protein GCM10023189_42870 [Nibrella saemangeumensis]|uniref:HTH cro/C1-type domain-containing protein n=1 Tax=Nibrella saemangeumensis TaxID=1084526 RepID=A0ABP8NDP5_9BACT